MSEPTTTTVLLVGRRAAVIDDVKRRLQVHGVSLIGCVSLDDVRAGLAAAPVDHVIMGAGIDIEARLEIIREVFDRSDTTTVHMKDRATGPDGFLPFIAAVLRGLDGYRKPDAGD